MNPRGRFAPSPTGRLHFGSLVAAFGSWLRARSKDGSWLVRIEDLDVAREVSGATADILATLSAFGFESDEPVLLQSQRIDLYTEAFQRLVDADHVYPCHCSRSDLATFNGIHPRYCLTKPAHNPSPPAWRIHTGNAEVTFEDQVCGRIHQKLASQVGDFVVRRADGGYAYQLAVVVDDSAQNIDEVVRGADLLDSTPRQIFLQKLLGLPRPTYLHLPLALDGFGAKLSKHDNARPVDPTDPLPALRTAAAFLGQSVPSCRSVDAFLKKALSSFDVGTIPCPVQTHVAMRKD